MPPSSKSTSGWAARNTGPDQKQPTAQRKADCMEVSRIRALRGPNLWCRHTAIEAIVACSDQSLLLTELPGFEDRLRARFPAIGPLRPDGARAGSRCAGPAGRCGLPGYLQPHRADARTRYIPGRCRIQRRGRGSTGVRAGRPTLPGRARRPAVRSGRRAVSLA